MKIGYVHCTDKWPLKDGSSIQSWNIWSRLAKKYEVFTTSYTMFPGANVAYKSIWDCRSFFESIDTLFIILDGGYHFQTEILVIVARFFYKNITIVGLINAPTEECLTIPWYNKNLFTIDKIRRNITLSSLDKVVYVSKDLFKQLHNKIKTKRQYVIANGSDPEMFSPKEELIKNHKKIFNILWAGGGVFRWQAIDLIAEVADKIYQIDKSIKFQIVSDDNWYPINTNKNITAFKSVDYFSVPKLLRKADLALVLYRQVEGLIFYNSPLKLFDAMSSQVPIIATNIGQIPLVIKDGVNGLLTNNKPDDVVDKILWIKNNFRKSVVMAKKARLDVVNRYNWSNMVNSIEKVLKR